MYLVAEYKTPANEVNQAVIWDKILLRAPRTVIIEKSANMKYYFVDYGQGLLGNENVTLTLNWNIIPYAGYLPQAQAQGSYQVKFPKQYVSGRF
uniref:Signal peptidase complex subunit 3 n=1 Tax=Panagrellus redivivus TaxID=6233 RepID=A0A7E4VLY6_PANRE